MWQYQLCFGKIWRKKKIVCVPYALLESTITPTKNLGIRREKLNTAIQSPPLDIIMSQFQAHPTLMGHVPHIHLKFSFQFASQTCYRTFPQNVNLKKFCWHYLSSTSLPHIQTILSLHAFTILTMPNGLYKSHSSTGNIYISFLTKLLSGSRHIVFKICNVLWFSVFWKAEGTIKYR